MHRSAHAITRYALAALAAACTPQPPDAAAASIERHRMRSVRVRLVDAASAPLADPPVRAEMTRPTAIERRASAEKAIPIF